ncbi:hypothetical protein VD0004_g2529 [Verticillium dahliae]|nr:hypothetical protein VD0004_g2529 [Verticillium dahliae]PNH74082.1 hypothetical protein VD0001_g3499 [Verticillium dahliae]
MESFAATFPRINIDSGFKGWFVSSLLLLAWLGSLVNGPIADWIGRNGSMLLAVGIFTVGSVFQTAANDVPLLFAARAIAGFDGGMLTMIVPMYISELSMPEIRGTLVVMQQLSITLGILVSYWLEYGTQYIGGTRCAPDIPYSGGTTNLPKFDPRYDVGPGGCTGQSDISWRIPFGLQILPALVLGIGMLFFPESPRFYLLRRKEDKPLAALAKIRRVHLDTTSLRNEYLGIKAEVLFEEALDREGYPAGWAGIAFIYIYDMNFSYSFAPIGWVLPSEIFNLGNRSKAMAITTSATWMSIFVIGLVTPDMLETIGYGT